MRTHIGEHKRSTRIRTQGRAHIGGHTYESKHRTAHMREHARKHIGHSRNTHMKEHI